MIGMAAAFPGCRGGIPRPLTTDPPPFDKPDLLRVFYQDQRDPETIECQAETQPTQIFNRLRRQ